MRNLFAYRGGSPPGCRGRQTTERRRTMNEQFLDGITAEPLIEPERYELSESPAYHFDLARRDFFKVLGGGVLIVFALQDAVAQQESGGGRRRGGGATLPQ